MSKRAKPANLPEALGAVRRLYAAIYRFDQRAAAALGIHPSDLRCVNALEKGGRTPSELGAELGLTSGSMTALLDRLERAGFIERKRAADDRRSVVVELRPEARARAGQVYGRLGRAIASGLAAHGPAVALNVIEALAEAFEHEQGGAA